jgi:acetaldehyde dehydrogenase
MKVKVAILGTGNIGTDLLVKILRTSTQMELAAFVGIDPNSDGLARARRFGISTTDRGIEGFLQMRRSSDR